MPAGSTGDDRPRLFPLVCSGKYFAPAVAQVFVYAAFACCICSLCIP